MSPKVTMESKLSLNQISYKFKVMAGLIYEIRLNENPRAPNRKETLINHIANNTPNLTVQGNLR